MQCVPGAWGLALRPQVHMDWRLDGMSESRLDGRKGECWLGLMQNLNILMKSHLTYLVLNVDLFK